MAAGRGGVYRAHDQGWTPCGAGGRRCTPSPAWWPAGRRGGAGRAGRHLAGRDLVPDRLAGRRLGPCPALPGGRRGRPVLLLLSVRGFGALQRARFRAVLGVDIPAPPGGGRRLAAAAVPGLAAPATWRQLGYHLLAMTGGTAGGALVAACWSAPAGRRLPGRPRGGRPHRPRPGGGRGGGGPAAGRAVGGQGRGSGRRGAAGPCSAQPRRGAGPAGRVPGPQPGRDRRRHRRRAAQDRARPARRRPAPAGLPGHAPGHGPGRPHRRARAGPPGHRAGPRRGHRGPGRAAPARPRPAPGRARRPRPGRGPVGDRRRRALPVRLRVDVAGRCSPSIEAVAYFVVSEALTNVAKHADAGSAEVTVERAGDRLRVVVSDDGRGGATLDGGRASATATRAPGCAVWPSGRPRSTGPHRRQPPGGPTTITVELPCGS